MDFAEMWDSFLTPRDREHLQSWGKKSPSGFGQRPALLVVDDYYRVLGLEREPLLESIKKWPMSCGLEGWAAIDKTVDLIAGARANAIPVIYLHAMEGKPLGGWGSREDTSGRHYRGEERLTPQELARANDIVAEIAPQPGDLVIEKSAASGFHGTPLLFQLNYLNIDTVITCGETTSGCVRASVVDGATFRFNMGVVGDCCFDRTEASHWINLFDMHQKYADVIDLQQALDYFVSVGSRDKVLASV